MQKVALARIELFEQTKYISGLVKAEWAPDGRHILCFSEWGVSGTHFVNMSL